MIKIYKIQFLGLEVSLGASHLEKLKIRRRLIFRLNYVGFLAIDSAISK